MIREAIDRIQELTRQAEAIERAPDYDITGAYFIREPDGSLKKMEATRRPVVAALRSTASFIDLVVADKAELALAHIFYNARGIQAVLSLEDVLRWSHHLELPNHPAFRAVEQLTLTREFTQRELIRFLRATLNGHVDDHIVEEFRALKVATDGESNAVIAKGREAVDKRIQQKILQDTGNAIPDQITVTVPVYDLDETRDELYDIEVLVDTTTNDAGAVVFELTTVLNSLRIAQTDALEEILRRLTANLERHSVEIPLYYGSASA